jgi:hypothetical protein
MQPRNQGLAKNAVKALLIVTEGPLVRQEDSVATPDGDKARFKSLAPDPRREIAQMAAKVRWADWASKKAL